MAAWWAEWSSYRLSDFLLFSPETYFRLIDLYNAAIWPAQVVATAIGVVILMLLRRPWMMAARVIALLLALAWAWVAWAFHLGHYASINWAAPWFAAAFACQAGLLLWYGLVRGQREVTPKAVRASVGQAVLAYALFIHPLIGLLAGRSVSQLGVFGSMPDPTVLATLGVMGFAADSVAVVRDWRCHAVGDERSRSLGDAGGCGRDGGSLAVAPMMRLPDPAGAG